MNTVFITGVAGFIGHHVAKWFLDNGWHVIGFDNLNHYYDPSLKKARLALHDGRPEWKFIEGDVCDKRALFQALAPAPDRLIVHLAAQAGVRWSLTNPDAYIQANLVGFGNILEACRAVNARHLVYASSSSVYGSNTKIPYSESDAVDRPISLYAATKKANELMAHAYSHLFGLPTTGLRFFTVYGPWGRPDMAYWKFTEAILKGQPIEVFGSGEMRRDFTYIDDVVETIGRIIVQPPMTRADDSPVWTALPPESTPWRIYNVGNRAPVTVNAMLGLLESICGRPAIRVDKPAQPGDVAVTYADVDALERDFRYRPDTPLKVGLSRFVSWYQHWSGSQAGR